MLKNSLKRFTLPLIAVLLAFLVYLYMRPVPGVTPVSQIATVPRPQAISLPWPATGQAALGAAGYGVLASHNTESPVPIGSIAKVITALSILNQKPISAGSQGPTITLSGGDVDLFNYYYARNGSVAQVNAGEQISEYQALQEVLIPSANNMADSLASWAFGSTGQYLTYANRMVKDLGLTNTKVGDTNGFSDTTTSTAGDLVKLGIAALDDPTIAKIVSQPSATVPVQGLINNTNSLLGKAGVVGIKTGNTDRAGGCYIFAARQNISGHNIELVGAVLGQPKLSDAINSVPALLQAVNFGFEQITVVHKNQLFGYFRTPWGATAQFRSDKDLPLFVWKGADIKVLNEPDTISAPAQTGDKVGKVTVQSSQQTGTSSLLLSQNLPGPSWHWRILH